MNKFCAECGDDLSIASLAADFPNLCKTCQENLTAAEQEMLSINKLHDPDARKGTSSLGYKRKD